MGACMTPLTCFLPKKSLCLQICLSSCPGNQYENKSICGLGPQGFLSSATNGWIWDVNKLMMM